MIFRNLRSGVGCPRRLLALLLPILLAACAGPTIRAVDQGEAVVAERLALHVDQPWNRFSGPNFGPLPRWTRDGIHVDVIEFYVAVKDGQPLLPPAKDKAPPLPFRATMKPHEITALFEALLARDGSVVALERLAPARFLGGAGFRFDLSRIRKGNDVRDALTGWGVVRNDELTVMLYSAPALHFYPRDIAEVERIAASAVLR